MRPICLFIFTAGQALKDLANSHSLICSTLALFDSTHYLDIQSHAITVINFIFLDMSYIQVSYCIQPDLKWFSDHPSLIIDLSITLENIYVYKIVHK